MNTSNVAQALPSPISCLPPELLTRIFFLSKFYDDVTHFIWNDGCPDYRTLITASQVSHRWREVAIGCPELWSDINVQYPEWAIEMLRRTRNTPIHIHSSFEDPNSLQIMASRRAISEIQRIKGLSLVASDAILKVLLDVLPEVAPRLQCLQLSSIVKIEHTSIDYSHLIPARTGIQVDSPLHDTSYMRQLVLHGFQMKWDSPFLRGLRHLSLSNMTFDITPTLSQFIDVLRSCPGLEYLYISDCDISDSDSLSNNVAELPRLAFFEFQASKPMTCIDLIERLLLPSSGNIRIQLDENSDIPPSDEKVWEIHLKRLLADLMASKVTSADEHAGSLFPTVQIDHNGWYSVRLSQAQFPTSYSQVESSPYVVLDRIQDLMDPIEDIGNQETTIRILTEILPLPHIKSFFVNTFIGSIENHPWAVEQIFWTLFLPILPQVRQIEIKGNSAFSFLEIFTKLDTEHTPAGDERHRQSNSEVCLPLLETIGFRCVNFATDIDKPFSPKRFYDFFALNFAYRPNFRGISLDNCFNLKSDDVSLLATVVNVRWDGRNTPKDEDDNDSHNYFPPYHYL